MVDQPRESIAGGLIRRNREIAEIREELRVCGLEVAAEQGKSQALLEESSEFDSEVFNHNKRAGNAEQRLAEVHYGNEKWESELAGQQATHAAMMVKLSGELNAHREALARAEAEAAAGREREAEVCGDLERLRGQLASESASLARVRCDQEERVYAEAASSSAAAAASVLLEEELDALATRMAAQEDETATARRHASAREADLVVERRRREELSESLRRAATEHADGPAELRALEAAVAARGGDARAALSRAAQEASSSEAMAGGGSPEQLGELKSELCASEGQCDKLRASLLRVQEEDSQAATRMQKELDNARGQLQRSLQEAANAHGQEVARLEAEVQAERMRWADEECAEGVCADRVAQLKELRSRALEERGAAIVNAQAEAGRQAALNEELQRARAEARVAAQRLAAARSRITEAHQRARQARADGDRRAARVKGMIADIWKGVRVAAAEAEAAPGAGGQASVPAGLRW